MKELDLGNYTDCTEIDYEKIDVIPRLDTKYVSYSDFFEDYIIQNRPAILKNVTNDWECTKFWVKNDTLNTKYFRENYSEAEVTVSNCSKHLFNVQEKCNMIMKDYLLFWENYPKDKGVDCFYLKDWHYTKCFPANKVYRVPEYFASDWLNEYYDLNKRLNDDFRFVYIGPKGSWTPFHCDVLMSFSWSANVCGRKRWILLAPGVENRFRNRFGCLNYSIDSAECMNEPGIFEIFQEKGEAIFVPSGWHHQVWNEEDAISINHNWINGCNILFIWESLKSSLADVKKEIADLEGADGWNEDCQKILGASFVFNYYQFYEFLCQIARERMRRLSEGKLLTVYGDWHMGRNHMIFDLKRILTVLKLMNNDFDFQLLTFNADAGCPLRFCDTLENFLKCDL